MVAGTGPTVLRTVAVMSWRWTFALVAAVATSCGGDGGTADTTSATTAPATTAPATTSPVTTAPLTDAPESTAAEPAGVVPEGFAAEQVRITAADGTICDVCLWLAATPEQRARGLMGVTDLGDADGMAFLYAGPNTGEFWMRDTPTPLSIAFFAADGTFVSAADMAPCLDGPAADCPRYAAAGPYTVAVEVFAGGLADLGIAAGSRLERLGTPCDPG